MPYTFFFFAGFCVKLYKSINLIPLQVRSRHHCVRLIGMHVCVCVCVCVFSTFPFFPFFFPNNEILSLQDGEHEGAGIY